MEGAGFTEYSTPILTASSPEGARDFLVPSRIHAGKFYALPQAPQQYKQLLMVAGFDRYFQIAPCFRDEDPRADRLPGEFYQLDLEMSFVTQEEVWETMEPVMAGIFEKFADGRKVTPAGEFPRIPYAQAMLDYGTDKPDLRNPLIIRDVTSEFTASGFWPVREDRRRRRHRAPDSRRRKSAGEEPQVLRRDERVGAQRRPRWPWLRHPQGRCVRRPDRQEPR
jgi:aspartyl-tRNA synthetase